MLYPIFLRRQRELASNLLSWLIDDNSRFNGNNRESRHANRTAPLAGFYRPSSSSTVRSMKSSSSGFWVGLPPRWPQIDGIGRSSACRIWGDFALVIGD